METFKFYSILVIVLCFTALSSAQLKHDWINAPMNPQSLLTAYRLDSQAPVKGDIVALNGAWFSNDKMYIDSKLFNDAATAKKYNGVYFLKNKKGQIIEETRYRSGEESKIVYSYNKNGQLAKVNNVSNNSSSSYSYDSKNRIIKEVYRNNNAFTTISFSYFKKGNVLEIHEKEFDIDNKLTSHYIHSYKDGLLISVSDENKEEDYRNDSKTTYKYEFDKYGNWIKQFANGDMLYPELEQSIIYREDLNNLNTQYVYVCNTPYFTYDIKLKSGELEIPFPTTIIEKDVIIYNPLEEEYFIVKNGEDYIDAANLGKAIPITSNGKGNNILNHLNVLMVNGSKVD